MLQSCPDAIDEVFDSKLHIIGGVGITIGIVMVCDWVNCNSSHVNISAAQRMKTEQAWSKKKKMTEILHYIVFFSLSDVWDDL